MNLVMIVTLHFFDRLWRKERRPSSTRLCSRRTRRSRSRGTSKQTQPFLHTVMCKFTSKGLFGICRDTTIIKTSETYSISFDGKEARLLIKSSTQESSGRYKIVVSSEYGKDESSAELVVEVTKNITWAKTYNATKFPQLLLILLLSSCYFLISILVSCLCCNLFGTRIIDKSLYSTAS